MVGLVSLLLTIGVADKGIYPELADKVELAPLPKTANAWLRVDPQHQIATLYDGDDPLKLYAIKIARTTRKMSDIGALGLRDADFAELRAAHPRIVVGAPARDEDVDGDGIVDRLDILVGAKKLLHNHARYV